MNDAENKTAAATETKTPAGVELEVPIIRGSQKITHVQLRRPKAGEMRGLSLSSLLQLDTSAVMTLLPRITQPTLVNHEVEALDPSHYTQVPASLNSLA